MPTAYHRQIAGSTICHHRQHDENLSSGRCLILEVCLVQVLVVGEGDLVCEVVMRMLPLANWTAMPAAMSRFPSVHVFCRSSRSARAAAQGLSCRILILWKCRRIAAASFCQSAISAIWSSGT